MVTNNAEIQILDVKASRNLDESFTRMLKPSRMVTKIRLVNKNIKTSVIQRRYLEPIR